MRIAEFSFQVRPCVREQDSGHVVMRDGQQYSLLLGNHDRVPCDAEVTIDGKEIETFRLDPHQTLTVEGPPDDPSRGKFTFYKSGTTDAAAAGDADVGKDDKGLIVVVFKPAVRAQYPDYSAILRSKGWGTAAINYPDAKWLSGTPQYGTVSNADDSGGQPRSCSSVNMAEGFAAVEAAQVRSAPNLDRKIATQGLNPGITGLSGRTDQKWEQAPAITHDESRTTTFRVRLVCGEDGPRPLAAKTPRDTPTPPPVG